VNPPADTDLTAALKRLFGFGAFRAGQEHVVRSVLEERDALVVMPTGGGKSLCYQLPAYLLDGVTVVISPLIALMKDQVDALAARGLAAAAVNSTLTFDQVRTVMADVRSGQVRLLYVAPERFASRFFMAAMAGVTVARVAVDEAHCISQWGHDFRPAYLRLKDAIARLGRPPVVALTATATPQVQDDIAALLGLVGPMRHVAGFDRHNLFLEVIPAGRKRDSLEQFVSEHKGPGIVYCATRRRVDEAAARLGAMGRRVVAYHAGLPDPVRTKAQDDFLGDRAEIIVATNAFGMGVDKPDVRFVLHYDMPGTLEAYYQEAGRAGRDDQPADCTLLYGAGDRFTQEFLINASHPSEAFVRALWRALSARAADEGRVEASHRELLDDVAAEGAEGGELAVSAALKLLEDAGWLQRLMPRSNPATIRVRDRRKVGARATVQRHILEALDFHLPEGENGTVQVTLPQLEADAGLDHDALLRGLAAMADAGAIDYAPPFRGRGLRLLTDEAPDLDYEAVTAKRRHALAGLDAMERYCRADGCRRAVILQHFGEPAPAARCGACDRCRAGAAAPVEATELARKLLSGVARCGGKRFGFGIQTVAAHLAGGVTEAVRRHGLDKLSTHGLLKAYTQRQVAGLLEALVDRGLLARQDVGEAPNSRPVLGITPEGLAVLRGEGTVALRLPDAKPAPASSAPRSAPGDADPVLLARLRDLRTRIAREEKVPAYLVFADRSLADMAARRPADLGTLAEVHGVGPAKLEKYGGRFLEALRSERETR
jgi:ATP-dependent DNA helicase RecQ